MAPTSPPRACSTPAPTLTCALPQTQAQVMLVRNLDLKPEGGRQLVNGSRGVVEGWAAKVRRIRDVRG
jgi:hypothetical protein